jgi:DNA-binding CsgD family transcriptional regulator
MTPPEPAELPAEYLAFLALTQSLMAERDPSMRYLGMNAEAGRALAVLAAQNRSTVWNMQRRVSFYALRDGRHLDEAARKRGVASRLVVNPASLPRCPILSSYDPDVRVGAVPFQLIVLDSRHIVLAGRDGDTMWTSSEPDLVARAVRAFEAVWSAARPAVPEGEEPPLTPRMVEICWLLADGASDRVISRALGISERTVSNEVREIGRRLGAANRAHTIARICGNPL